MRNANCGYYGQENIADDFWDGKYIKMVKDGNVFNGCYKIPGIYIIENIKTNECYVGRSINIFKRIQQHLYNKFKDTPEGDLVIKLLEYEQDIKEQCKKETMYMHKFNCELNDVINSLK
jgi:predicted GIY-YIG superfamily endonuclease